MIFKLKCEKCNHEWGDIYKTYCCPKCYSQYVKIVNNEKREGIFTEGGQSLIGVLVAMGIMSVLMLSIAGMMMHTYKVSNTAVVNSDINEYVTQIRGNLQDPTMSTKALVFNDVTKPMSIIDPLTSNVLAQPGYRPKNAVWTVTAVTVDGRSVVSGQVYRLTLGISIMKDRNKVYGSQFQHKTLGDVYCTLNSNVIINCSGGAYLFNMAEQLCKSIGFDWTGTTCVVPPNVNTNNGKPHQ